MADVPLGLLAESFVGLWRAGTDVPDVWRFLAAHPQADPAEVAGVLVADQWERHRAGCPRPVEDYLAAPAVAGDTERRLDLVYGDYRAARHFGRPTDTSGLAARFPDLAEALSRHLALDALMSAFEAPSPDTSSPGDTLLPDRSVSDGRPTDLASATVDSPTAQVTAGVAVAESRLGRFTLRGKLGAGAFGEVFRAYDAQLDREVALKVAKPGALNTPERRQRFLREAKAAANLRHPNIVPLFDAGDADGHSFIASALIRGRTLEAEIGDTAGKPLELARAAVVIRRLAEALGYAHRQGVTHRDVKPANTLVDESGEPHLLDFGLAARAGDDALQTQDGCVMGTPAYMSPEQAAGRSADATAACDQYALGVMLFEMATGRRPFVGATDAVLYGHIHVTPPRPRSVNPAVPRDLETVILKCLEKEPAKRYASCEELAEDLRRFGAGEPVTARRIGPLERAARWAKRNPAVAGSMAVAALALLVGTAVSLWQAAEARGQAMRANSEAERADGESREARKQEAEAKGQARRAKTVQALTAGLFHSSDPTGLSGVGLLPPSQRSKSLTLADILARGSETLTDTLKDDPLTRAALLDVLGDVNRTMGNRTLAAAQLGESLRIREELLRADHEDVAASRYHLANWHSEGGDVFEAERLYAKLLQWHADRGTLETSAGSEVRLRLSVALTSIQDPAGEDLARLALATRERTRGPADRETEIARMVLASALMNQGEKGESQELILKAFQSLASDEAAQKDPVVRAALEYMRSLVLGTISPRLGEAGLVKACQLMEDALGPDHLYLALPKCDLGLARKRNGKLPEAERSYQESLAIVRKTVGLGDPRVVVLLDCYSQLLGPQGRRKEAWALIDEAYARTKEKYPSEFRWHYKIVCLHGHYAGRMGLPKVAFRDADDAIALMRQLNRPLTELEQMRFVTLALGVLYTADPPNIRAFRARIAGPTGPPLCAEVRAMIDNNYCSSLLLGQGHAEAEPILREIVARDLPQPTRAKVVSTTYVAARALAMDHLSHCCWRTGRLDEAEKWMREALRLERKIVGSGRVSLVSSSLMDLLILRQKWADVSAVAAEYPIAAKPLPADNCRLATVRAAANAFSPTPQANKDELERIEKLYGQSADHDITLHRARIVLLRGGDLKRERDRLTAFLPTDPAVAELRGRFEIALGNFAFALVDPKASGTPATDEARHRLHRLVSAYAAVKTRPSAETDKALAAELAEADTYLATTPDVRDPAKAENAIGLVLELHFWSRKIRAERK